MRIMRLQPMRARIILHDCKKRANGRKPQFKIFLKPFFDENTFLIENTIFGKCEKAKPSLYTHPPNPARGGWVVWRPSKKKSGKRVGVCTSRPPLEDPQNFSVPVSWYLWSQIYSPSELWSYDHRSSRGGDEGFVAHY